jgi:hypothetical protein
MSDDRSVKLPELEHSIRQEILDGAKDENQRRLLHETMQSHAWKMSELVLRNAQLEKENAKLRGLTSEMDRAAEARDKATEKLAASEKARKAAERVAERERFARISAEESKDELLAALQHANRQQSRLERLLETHGREA